MSARDELAALAEAIRSGSLGTSEMADAILAAGYSKPRQVGTVEELDALPAGSILLSRSEYPRYAGTLWRVTSGGMIEKVGRELEGVTPFRYFRDPLPATVLYEPPLPHYDAPTETGTQA